ncbi:hypothetical protein ABEX25_25780 [Paenibacillus thiaminolyticus]|uniref:hypothetical protein n=1 Tax=Paenibacillus thiaminolyticus TaxID=49283 RepID=UPI003D2D9EAC
MTAIRAVSAVYESCPAYRDVRIGPLKQLLPLFGVFACSAGILTRLAAACSVQAACSVLLVLLGAMLLIPLFCGACEELYRIRPRLPER